MEPFLHFLNGFVLKAHGFLMDIWFIVTCHDMSRHSIYLFFVFVFSDESNKKNFKIIRLKEINIYKST